MNPTCTGTRPPGYPSPCSTTFTSPGLPKRRTSTPGSMGSGGVSPSTRFPSCGRRVPLPNRPISAPALSPAACHAGTSCRAWRSSALATERVGNTEVLRECIEVMRVGFELPELTSEVFFEAFTTMGLTEESPLRSYVGRLEGEAVAASSLLLAAGVAGIYNVATLPKARRQGLGAAVTLEGLREARELVYRIGVLQSSAMGFGVYRRLGFEQYSTYTIYVGTGQE